MASKINNLPAVSSVLSTDITNIVRSPFNPGDDHKITMADFSTSIISLGGAITSLNADTTVAQLLTVGTSGSDFAITNPGGGSHVLNLPTASSVNRGALSPVDWSTFNSKQAGSASLTALAALSGTGFITQTGSNTFSERTLTGTTNQIVITNGDGVSGNPVFSLPQSISTGSSPTFTNLTLSGLTANSFLYSGTSGLLTTTAAPTNGQLLIGSTGVAPVKASLTGTTNQVNVTNGAGTITLTTPQDIATTSSPQFSFLGLGVAASNQIVLQIQKNFSVSSAVDVFGISTNISLSTSTNNNSVLTGISQNIFSNASDTHTISAIVGEFMSISHTANTFLSTITGIQLQAYNQASTANGGQVLGIDLDIESNSTGTINSVLGIEIGLVTNGIATEMIGIIIDSPSVSTSATSTYGIFIDQQSTSGGTTSYAINILDQGTNAITTRAINIAGAGIGNAIMFDASTNLYANTANNLRITDSSNTGGLSFSLSTTSVTINTVTTNNAGIILQNQTFTTTANHIAINLVPTWSQNNALYTAFNISATQNGANNLSITGLQVGMTKATAATTLDTSTGISVTTPTTTGTITLVRGIAIFNQSLSGGTTAYALNIGTQNANATTTRAIRLQGTGIANAIRFADSVNLYATGANNLTFSDTTDARNISLTLTAASDQTIATSAGGLILQTTGGSISFLGGTPQTLQVSGANLTNNVTAGGTTNVVDDITIGVSINAADGVTTRNAVYQLARKLKQVNDALRLYGLLT